MRGLAHKFLLACAVPLTEYASAFAIDGFVALPEKLLTAKVKNTRCQESLLEYPGSLEQRKLGIVHVIDYGASVYLVVDASP